MGASSIHNIAIVGAVIWFCLNGLLWYVRPSNSYWLIGSAILGVLFFGGFMFYLQRTDDEPASRDWIFIPPEYMPWIGIPIAAVVCIAAVWYARLW